MADHSTGWEPLNGANPVLEESITREKDRTTGKTGGISVYFTSVSSLAQGEQTCAVRTQWVSLLANHSRPIFLPYGVPGNRHYFGQMIRNGKGNTKPGAERSPGPKSVAYGRMVYNCYITQATPFRMLTPKKKKKRKWRRKKNLEKTYLCCLWSTD